ncbi:hypothetical protein MMC27_004371 [Xylographa pallens]|nr:hypothetical protein [Xylographa pallens]
MKTAVDFIETNPNQFRRRIYFRRRPMHGLVKQPFLRRFVQDESPGHWAIEVGEYVWELEIQNCIINYHVGIWINPNHVDGHRLGATEREAVGDTVLTDLEINEIANQVQEKLNRRISLLLPVILLPFKIPAVVGKVFTQKRYSETLNNCQDFADRLAASIDLGTGIPEKRTRKLFGRDVKITYHTAKTIPIPAADRWLFLVDLFGIADFITQRLLLLFP